MWGFTCKYRSFVGRFFLTSSSRPIQTPRRTDLISVVEHRQVDYLADDWWCKELTTGFIVNPFRFLITYRHHLMAELEFIFQWTGNVLCRAGLAHGSLDVMLRCLVMNARSTWNVISRVRLEYSYSDLRGRVPRLVGPNHHRDSFSSTTAKPRHLPSSAPTNPARFLGLLVTLTK